MRTLLLSVAVFVCAISQALPAMPDAIRQIFNGRKELPAVEVTMLHHVELPSGEAVDFEERLVRDGTRISSLWKGAGQAAIGVKRDKEGYDAGGGKKIRPKSHVFTKYFLTNSPETLKEQLISERFLRRDQCLQYKSTFDPQGDPQTWNLKENYIRHPDIGIYFFPNETAPAIRVIGDADQNARRVLYLDKALQGVRRLEWQEGAHTASWDFTGYETLPGLGIFPKHMVFEQTGSNPVQTTLVRVRSLNPKMLSEYSKAFSSSDRSGTFPPNVEAALRLVLGYR